MARGNWGEGPIDIGGARVQLPRLPKLPTGSIRLAVIAVAALLARSPSPRTWAIGGLLCCWSHIAMDYFTVGRGVMLFWPLSLARFDSPVKAFYGLRWSAGLWSTHHLYTFVTEILFIASLLFLLRQAAGAACGKMTAR